MLFFCFVYVLRATGKPTCALTPPNPGHGTATTYAVTKPTISNETARGIGDAWWVWWKWFQITPNDNAIA